MEPVLKLRKIIKYYEEDWYIDNDYWRFPSQKMNKNNKQKHIEKYTKRKTSFQKEEVENADLYEAALNKIMSTCE